MVTAPDVRVSASIRLVYAMLRLAADIETQFGKYILDLLKRQYPDGEPIDLTATQIGHMMVNRAKKELQNDYHAAQEAVQDFMMKIMAKKGGGVNKPEFDFKAPTQKGNPGAATWRAALKNILNNIRTTAMSQSMKKFRKVDPSDGEAFADLKWKKDQSAKGKYDWTDEEQAEMDELAAALKADGQDPDKIPAAKAVRKGQRTRTIDEAFGTRGEEGGDPSGGEARIPDTGTGLGKALDDKAAIKEFMDLLEEEVPNLRKTLSPEELALFDLIFYDEVGGFGSDIKDNMGQASELKDKLMQSEPGKAIVQKNEKRWSGFVGDTRKKLLSRINDFVENTLSPAQQQVLYDTFFSDTTEGELESAEQKKEAEKDSYQRGIDERKMARYKWEIEQGTISDKDKKSYESLLKKMKDSGVDVDAIKASENPDGSAKTTKDKRQKKKTGPDAGPDAGGSAQQASFIQIAARVAHAACGW